VAYFSQSSETYDCYHAQDCIGANALSRLRQRQLIPHFVRTVHHIEAYNSVYLQQCQERSIRDPTFVSASAIAGNANCNSSIKLMHPE
jgi:hypothetical protein